MNALNLNERAARRTDWVGGWPIRLANGEDWLLAFPDITWRSTPGDPDSAVMVTDPPLDVTELHALADPETDTGQIPALCLNLGKALLQRNYTLTGDQAAALLALPQSAESPIVEALRRTAAKLAGGLQLGGEARLRALELSLEETIARLEGAGLGRAANGNG